MITSLLALSLSLFLAAGENRYRFLSLSLFHGLASLQWMLRPYDQDSGIAIERALHLHPHILILTYPLSPNTSEADPNYTSPPNPNPS